MLEFTSWLLVFAHLLLGFIGIIFLLSGADDFFIDLNFICRSLFRTLFVLPKHKRLSVDDVRAVPEQLIAVMVPAWDESTVIRRMLENTLRILEYSNYHVFVGTYPNDPDTAREMDYICGSFPNVHRTVCPKDGPTNKADCLNWIYQGIRVFEKENDITFEIFLMEDCEDIVHPLSLKLFNRLIPSKDMVQLPVFPLETKWYDFTSGHYIDEFAENHSKDLWVRERLAKGIPAAGVGCAFSRAAFERIACQRENQLFNIDSLTEDYEFGLRLRNYTLKGIFVRQRLVTSKQANKQRGTRAAEYVAVRGYFPSTFKTAVRQKSRWVVGIALQGWSNLGWRGDLWTRYMYLRDRKTLLTSQINVLGYVVVLIQCSVWAVQWLMPFGYRYPPIVERGGFLWNLLLVDAALMANRLAWRITSVYRLYGCFQALLSIPRQVWANVINAAAAIRAVHLYIGYLRTGVLVKWDKTAHVFPSEAELAPFHKRLGDLLMERKLISRDDLESALSWQEKLKRPLGNLLVRMGSIDEKALTEVLSAQLHLQTEKLDPRGIPSEVLHALPRHLAIRYSAFPARILEDGRLLLAVADRLKPQHVVELEAAVGRKISICLTTRSELGMALRLVYGTAAYGPEEEAFPAGVPSETKTNAEARSTYRRLGEILVDEEMISPAALDAAVGHYASSDPQHLGEYLLRQALITPEQLEQALQLQGPQTMPEAASTLCPADDDVGDTHTKLQETVGD
ncbi:MAG: glycosyl transferase family protein [Bryobacteraceae bacterium]